MFELSIGMIILLAFFSAVSRAGLNIVDRYQIGHLKISVLQVNFWNNVIPAILLSTLCFVIGWKEDLISFIFSFKSFTFSLLAQIVAYSFSYAFGKLNVAQVLVASKLSDLFIPFGIFLTTMYWSWDNFWFSFMTTLVCLLILFDSQERSMIRHKMIIFTMIIALFFQSSLSPILSVLDDHITFGKAMTFTTSVIVWRVFWSFLPYIRSKKKTRVIDTQLLISPIFNVRVLLTTLSLIRTVLS